MRLPDVLTVLREDGPRWLAYRLGYEAQLRWGFRRSLPPVADIGVVMSDALGLPVADLDSWLYRSWREYSAEYGPVSNCVARGKQYVYDVGSVVDLAERTLRGDFRYFSRAWRNLGYPPDWFRGLGVSQWDKQAHWSRLPDLSHELGDIKHVWEPSRFSFVYGLVRAWAATGDERYPEAFWHLAEHWMDSNHPELGPHWRCAQEMSFRCMAWSFGLHMFRDCSSSTPTRVTRLIKQIWYHALHIEKVHWYAKECVRNNHAISEAVGLLTVGTLLPFLPHGRRWQELGVQRLATELSWQVYDDGSYIQHSMNYARLVVQLLTWTIGLAKVNQVGLPTVVTDRAQRLLQFLVSLQDPSTGRVPNYGSNDGALIFPLSTCDYLDYRPALGALSLALGQGRLYPSGPWDEEAAWLVGDELVKQPEVARERTSTTVAFNDGGYYRLVGDSTQAVIRCATYKHRPGQADMLHLDVWYGGHNVLVDPGTYSYNLRPPWSRYFVGTAAHNSVTVDGKDQMRKASRFMWLNWTKSKLLQFKEVDGSPVFSGEHYGYRPIVHRRTVVLKDEVYIVVDELKGAGQDHTFRLHWLVNDYPLRTDTDGATITLPDGGQDLRLVVHCEQGGKANWARADEVTPRGWQSLHYGQRVPAWSMEWIAKGQHARFVTVLGPIHKVEQLQPLITKDPSAVLSGWGIHPPQQSE